MGCESEGEDEGVVMSGSTMSWVERMGCNMVRGRVWCIVQEEEKRRSRKEGDG